MIAGQLTHLAGEMHAAIGQQDFRFADAAGVENDLAGRRIAGVVLVRDAEIEIAERHPDPLAAPADVDGLAFERHRLAERRTGLRRQLLLETRPEREVSGMDNQLAHLSNLAIIERISLPPCVNPGKPCLGLTSMDEGEKPQRSVAPGGSLELPFAAAFEIPFVWTAVPRMTAFQSPKLRISISLTGHTAIAPIHDTRSKPAHREGPNDGQCHLQRSRFRK